MYPEGTLVFKVDRQSREMDAEESDFSTYCLAPNHETENLLRFEPCPGEYASTHPNNGYEYIYDLLNCKIIMFDDEYAVLEVWSNTEQMFRAGYNNKVYPWKKRKIDYWYKYNLDEIISFSLERISQDFLVPKLEIAYQVMFPNNLNINELYDAIEAKLEEIRGLYDDSTSKFDNLDKAIYGLGKKLKRLSSKSCMVKDVQSELNDFQKEADIHFRNNVIIDEFLAKLDHYMLYMHYDMTTPSSVDRMQSATDKDIRLNYYSNVIKTYCAQYCLTPSKSFTTDYSISQEEQDKLRSDGLSDCQIVAFDTFMKNPVSLLWGPPGSGKSYTIKKYIEFYYSVEENKDKKILISAANNNAVDSLCEGIPALYRFDSRSNKLTRDHYRQNKILASTPQQIFKAYLDRKPVLNFSEGFDMVIIDEAGQMPPAQVVLCLLALRENARLILVGDDLQLNPIHQYVPPEGQGEYVSSAYSYYKNRHRIEPVALDKSYRSHPVIVDFLASISYPGFSAAFDETHYQLDFVNDDDETKSFKSSVIDVICEQNNAWSEKHNSIQVNEAISIIQMLIQNGLKSKNGHAYTLNELFTEGVAIITPFRSQKNSIRRVLQKMILQYLKDNGREVEYTELRATIDSCVDTVHKFQGLQRQIVIVSLPTGLKESINDKLLLDPHLLNVAISRAQSKLIIMCTKNSLEWIKSQDTPSSSLFKFDNILAELVDFCGRHGVPYRIDNTVIYRK